MFRKTLFLTVLILSAVYSLWSLEKSEPVFFLGNQISDIFGYPFLPEEIFPNRGPVENDDNVIFYYSDGFYLFLFADRVWQVRYDRTYEGFILGVQMGMSRGEILSYFNTPLKDVEEYVIFQIKDTPYPVRIKLYFENEILDDLYVYRADY